MKSLKVYTGEMGIPAFISRLQLVAMAKREGDLKDFEGKDVSQFPQNDSPYPKGERFLGKLGFKIEAAGKVRVFAMVDAWTQ